MASSSLTRRRHSVGLCRRDPTQRVGGECSRSSVSRQYRRPRAVGRSYGHRGCVEYSPRRATRRDHLGTSVAHQWSLAFHQNAT
eukprot:728587-Amphidinium_carterae.2